MQLELQIQLKLGRSSPSTLIGRPTQPHARPFCELEEGRHEPREPGYILIAFIRSLARLLGSSLRAPPISPAGGLLLVGASRRFAAIRHPPASRRAGGQSIVVAVGVVGPTIKSGAAWTLSFVDKRKRRRRRPLTSATSVPLQRARRIRRRAFMVGQLR